ncbi:MAG: hypothetical protein J5872_03405 [Lachnospiraceae bacterium]|nr:hypothetical protein [Lachnospiraceae bacterium]
MAEEINETLLEEQSEPSEQDHEVDESVRIIREVSASTEAENTNFTPEVRDKGDSFFRYTVSYGLVAVGIIMVALAAFTERFSNLFVGGVLFALFGLFLDFLTRKVKKD